MNICAWVSTMTWPGLNRTNETENDRPTTRSSSLRDDILMVRLHAQHRAAGTLAPLTTRSTATIRNLFDSAPQEWRPQGSNGILVQRFRRYLDGTDNMPDARARTEAIAEALAEGLHFANDAVRNGSYPLPRRPDTSATATAMSYPRNPWKTVVGMVVEQEEQVYTAFTWDESSWIESIRAEDGGSGQWVTLYLKIALELRQWVPPMLPGGLENWKSSVVAMGSPAWYKPTRFVAAAIVESVMAGGGLGQGKVSWNHEIRKVRAFANGHPSRAGGVAYDGA